MHIDFYPETLQKVGQVEAIHTKPQGDQGRPFCRKGDKKKAGQTPPNEGYKVTLSEEGLRRSMMIQPTPMPPTNNKTIKPQSHFHIIL